jgi:hypothetical protein
VNAGGLTFFITSLLVPVAQVKLQIAVENQNPSSGSARRKPPRANLFPNEALT